MTASLGRIYDKVQFGDRLTDHEVVAGEKLYKGLTDRLYAAGPSFIIVAKETNRMYLGLKSAREARGLEQLG